jgi:hypothetical protein
MLEKMVGAATAWLRFRIWASANATPLTGAKQRGYAAKPLGVTMSRLLQRRGITSVTSSRLERMATWLLATPTVVAPKRRATKRWGPDGSWEDEGTDQAPSGWGRNHSPRRMRQGRFSADS